MEPVVNQRSLAREVDSTSWSANHRCLSSRHCESRVAPRSGSHLFLNISPRPACLPGCLASPRNAYISASLTTFSLPVYTSTYANSHTTLTTSLTKTSPIIMHMKMGSHSSSDTKSSLSSTPGSEQKTSVHGKNDPNMALREEQPSIFSRRPPSSTC